MKQEQENHTIKDTEYNGILKYTGLFGGVQGLVSLITLFRVSIVSRLLGPIGAGFNDIYNRSIDLGKKATDLGISFSAVQTISERRNENDEDESASMAYAIKVVRSWSLWLSLFGTLLFFLLAPLLSAWSFEGDCSYTPLFRLLSLTIGCSALMGGELAVLKGAHKLNRLAWYQLTSALIVLAVSIPCYYVWGLRGIVPSLLFSAIVFLIAACWHSFKVAPYQVSLFSRKVIKDGIYIIRQGINYTLAGLLGSGAYYLISIYIFRQGNAAEVGCYSYGTLLISYLSMLIFAVLDNDYVPRLSAANKDYIRSYQIVNSQAEMLMILITPLVAWFAVCLPFVTPILFDEQFMPLVEMTQLAAVGLLFRAIMLPTAYLPLSKGDSLVYLLQESLSYLFMIIAMIGGFKLFGLKGLGAGILLSNLFDWLSVWLIVKFYYRFSYSRSIGQLLGIQVPLLACLLVICMYTQGWTYLILGLITAIATTLHSFRILQRNTNLVQQLLAKARKRKA